MDAARRRATRSGVRRGSRLPSLGDGPPMSRAPAVAPGAAQPSPMWPRRCQRDAGPGRVPAHLTRLGVDRRRPRPRRRAQRALTAHLSRDGVCGGERKVLCGRGRCFRFVRRDPSPRGCSLPRCLLLLGSAVSALPSCFAVCDVVSVAAGGGAVAALAGGEPGTALALDCHAVADSGREHSPQPLTESPSAVQEALGTRIQRSRPSVRWRPRSMST
jgi:hypothetical protein